jgi:hypothetical protein
MRCMPISVISVTLPTSRSCVELSVTWHTTKLYDQTALGGGSMGNGREWKLFGRLHFMYTVAVGGSPFNSNVPGHPSLLHPPFWLRQKMWLAWVRTAPMQSLNRSIVSWLAMHIFPCPAAPASRSACAHTRECTVRAYMHARAAL